MAPFKSSKGKDSIVSKFLKISAASKLGLGLGAAAETTIPFVASGGTVTDTGDRKIHLFESPGTFTVAQGSANLDIIIVGGGGRSGSDRGGGGGGGGVFYRVLEPAGTGYSRDVVIGNGGGQGGNANGNAGGNSTWGSPGPEQYIAYGGGSGMPNPGNSGATGGGRNGNGGGGSGADGNKTIPGGTTITQGNNSLPVQGFPGGDGTDSAPRYGGGGGGGAGGAGGNGTTSQGGDGGIGLGPPTWNWLPTSFGDDGYFGGGGGGGNIEGPNASGGKGGGGGAFPTGTPTAGSNGTGGGGGGGGNGGSNNANGGKGAVLVSYPK